MYRNEMSLFDTRPKKKKWVRDRERETDRSTDKEWQRERHRQTERDRDRETERKRE